MAVQGDRQRPTTKTMKQRKYKWIPKLQKQTNK